MKKISLSIFLLFSSVLAQSSVTGQTVITSEDQGFPWGIIGLLGLLGLARKRRIEYIYVTKKEDEENSEKN